VRCCCFVGGGFVLMWVVLVGVVGVGRGGVIGVGILGLERGLSWVFVWGGRWGVCLVEGWWMCFGLEVGF